MAGNRKAAQAEILAGIEKILPGSENTRIYKELFDAMSDRQFDDLIQALEEKTKHLALVAPNLDNGPKLTLERNLAVGEEWGVPFFERIWIDEGNGTPPYLSPIRYLVLLLPLRRQAQHLIKKVSIPEDNNTVDDFTGQPTGPSKGSKLSYPEIQILSAHDLDFTMRELLKYRGGDEKGFNAMNASISKTGAVSLQAIEPQAGKVKSTTTLSTLLTCAHLENTL